MRTLRFLGMTLLMVLFAANFAACSKDDYVDEGPLIVYVDDGKSAVIDGIFKTFMKDYSDINCRYASRESSTNMVILSGVKGKHLWASLYNGATMQKIYEWEDDRDTDTILKEYLGYGEYKNTYMTRAIIEDYKKTNTGIILGFRLVSYTNLNLDSFTIFASNGRNKRVEGSSRIRNWYKESVFIGEHCYSHEGDTIYLAKRLPSFHPTSYEEGIEENGNFISKYNYKIGKCVWKTELPFELPSDTRLDNITLLDSSTNIWKYKFDFTNYDGTKVEYNLKINIDDGLIIE